MSTKWPKWFGTSINVVKAALKKELEGLKSTPNKKEIVEKVKLQVINELGARVQNIDRVEVEKTVLNAIEEVWTDMKSMFNEETGIWGDADDD